MHRCAPLAALGAAFVLALPAAAQVQRSFPANALRGELVFGQPPEVMLNAVPMRLAPGARIRGRNNMIVLSGALVGAKALVHYTVDSTPGLLKDVWILTAAEAAKKPWPATDQEAKSWAFDPAAQVWSKP